MSDPRYPPPLPRSLLTPRHWPLWLVLGGLRLLGGLAPGLRFALGGMLGRLAMAQNGKRREIVATNLAWCFRDQEARWRDSVARAYPLWLGRSYLEFGFLWWASRSRFLARVEFEGLERVETLLGEGERVILITLHSLAMDVGGTALSARIPLTTFANAMRNPLLEWMVAERRGRFGCRIHPRSAGLRPVIRELKAGRVLFFPCDEDQGLRKTETVFAPFFGIAKSTLTSPLRLARMGGARLLPTTCWFDEVRGRYIVKVYEALPLNGEEGHDGALINHAFEQAIGEAPAQYLWSQRLFTTRPDGAPPPYTMKGKRGSGPRLPADSDFMG